MWTGNGDPHPEFETLIICRDVYHCTPSELDEQDWKQVQTHFALYTAEKIVEQKRRDAEKEKSQQKRGKRKR